MSFPIQQLIDGRSQPVTVSLDDTLQRVFDLMMKHDFSQLPIVDSDGRVGGIVTTDSVLRGLHFTQTTTSRLNVIDIKTDAPTGLPDDDIFDVLERMRGYYACLIVDDSRHLIGIITDFDTSEYFRRRAENIMLVEDIERTIKDFILFAYPRAAGGTDNTDLLLAVQQVTAPPRELAQFKQALAKYMNLTLPNSGQINASNAAKAFEVYTTLNTSPKGFEDLTLAEYIALLLHNGRWKQYQAAIRLDREAVFRMLDAVRIIRNKLAHFTGEVTETEQEQLRYCLKWLEDHQSMVQAAFQPNVVAQIPTIDATAITPSSIVEPEDGTKKTAHSRYAALARYLKREAEQGKSTVLLTFNQIETIIETSLPPFARKHRSWWANDSTSRVQSKQWLDAGWKVQYVDMEREIVGFGLGDTRIAVVWRTPKSRKGRSAGVNRSQPKQ